LLVASEVTDILWGVLALTGVETIERNTWSHSLTTSVGLSAIAALLAGRAYRDTRTGAVVGLVVLSHWVLDFVVWKNSLPLLFEGSPKVGLGLYGGSSAQGVQMSLPVMAIEFGLPILGLIVYLQTKGVFRRRWALANRRSHDV
jgi:hypothetical protein